MNRYLFKISAVSILVLAPAVVWFGCWNPAYSPVGLAQVAPRQISHTEDMNTEKLNALLEDSGVRVDVATLLPRRIDRSQIITARLRSQEDEAAKEYSEEMPENFEVSLVKTKRNTGALSRQRVLEFSEDQILVIAVDSEQQALWWSTQPDPRIFRAEISDDKGNLSGRTIYRKEADMLVSLPDRAAIVEIRFFHPVWNGVDSYSLKQIGWLNLQ